MLDGVAQVLDDDQDLHALHARPVHEWDARVALQLLQERGLVQYILHGSSVEFGLGLELPHVVLAGTVVVECEDLLAQGAQDYLTAFEPAQD